MKFNLVEHKVGLCKNRHRMVVESYIFPEIVSPMDITRLEQTAISFIEKLYRGNIPEPLEYTRNSITLVTITKYRGVLHLYITGLTSAVLAVVNACILLNVKLVIWHYDKDTEDYVAQIMQ